MHILHQKSLSAATRNMNCGRKSLWVFANGCLQARSFRAEQGGQRLNINSQRYQSIVHLCHRCPAIRPAGQTQMLGGPHDLALCRIQAPIGDKLIDHTRGIAFV